MKAQNRKVIELKSMIAAKNVQSRILPKIKYDGPELVYCLLRAIDVAKSDLSVLIQGETGVGKERICKLIHEQSNRREKELVIVDCATLDGNLILSDLFGHCRGAFTGADAAKQGYFEIANCSSIFLDEIGELPMEVQIRLLRILQEGTFTRLGETKPRKTNVRIIAATNKDLVAEVENKRFREDLFYRLNKFPIRVPPLRERLGDIPTLANHFKDLVISSEGVRIVRIPDHTLDFMKSYPWPGNVRELENAIARSLVNCQGEEVLPEHLELESKKTSISSHGLKIRLDTLDNALNQFKENFILINLAMTEGNRSLASKVMDIQRTYLSRLITRFFTEKGRDIDNEIKALPLNQCASGGFLFDTKQQFSIIKKLEKEIEKLESKQKNNHEPDLEINRELEKTKKEKRLLELLVAEMTVVINASCQREEKRSEKNAMMISLLLKQLLEMKQVRTTDAEKNTGLRSEQKQKEEPQNKNIKKLILKLKGARELKRDFPGLTPGQMTMEEAVECVRLRLTVARIRATEGNIEKAANISGNKNGLPALYRRIDELEKKHTVSIRDLAKDVSFKVPSVENGITINNVLKSFRNRYFDLVFRFCAGDRNEISEILGITPNRCHQYQKNLKIEINAQELKLYINRKINRRFSISYEPVEKEVRKALEEELTRKEKELEAQRPTKSDITAQITELVGTKSFVRKYPGIVPGKTTLKEALEYISTKQNNVLSDEFKREYIELIFRFCCGHYKEAMQILGMDPAQYYGYLKKLGIGKEAIKDSDTRLYWKRKINECSKEGKEKELKNLLRVMVGIKQSYNEITIAELMEQLRQK